MSTLWNFLPKIHKRKVVYLSMTHLTPAGIILIGEVGGKGELSACDYIKLTKLDERKHNPALNKLTLDPSWHISPDYAPVQGIQWVIQVRILHQYLLTQRRNKGQSRQS